ncbi:Peptidase S8/S53 domain [Arabidopsis thaliana x Arabidopsis arenosa]|uniref:Peptidase S8/S53 domain n=1 Tax=Arabidopsis thaliana x Arabidopsis arenosa TaxID=1240361 RepID=A0A8T1XJW1_9BRAS|nr:Peptidase S8/S53 domain [Arabidopsis thaliana x Arabidopsis arenosa]
MAKGTTFFFLFSSLLVLFLSSVSADKDDHEDQQVYIVYLGALPSREDYTPMSDHMSILQEVTGESLIENRLVRSYKRSFNGFAARLTESERKKIAGMAGVVSVFPSRKLKLQTTSSWNFMGLKEGIKTKRNPSIESDTIIGVIDTGIYPESNSFSDQGFGPPPKKWKGTCAGGKNFTCNNKVIGARDYKAKSKANESTRDYSGHGTHTASTAAGNAVANSNFYGLGNGTARGGVPAARIAVYKVCDNEGCDGDAIISAFDDAIADGVDVITISIILDDIPPFEEDPIAIGGFHAMAVGVLTVNAAGNNGPKISTVSSTAPWVFSVAASITNRAFMAKVVLGDGKILIGRSVNTYDLNGTKYPLVYGKSAALSTCSEEKARLCEPKCLDGKLVKGKIVLCDSSKGPIEAQKLGAVGSIVKNPEPDHAFIRSFPVSFLSNDDYKSLVSYMNSTKDPKATVLKSEEISNQTAPIVASFSSRGPSSIVSDILKPDITAPGVEILAAYSPDSTPTESEFDTRHVKFSVMSGTSMACPHVAGVAAYVKTFHPKWSPSMIKSAIMTTAWPMNASGPGFVSTEFAYGSGHVDPIAAINPGLVYELTKADHITFLCGLNYSSDHIRIISGDNSTCTKELSKTLPRNLNYPTMSAKVSGTEPFNITFQRTVTNVGMKNSTYKAKVVTSPGSKLRIKVLPRVLSMKSINEKQSFVVTVSGDSIGTKQPLSANLIWFDGTHNVRSPIVVYAMS